MSKILNNIKIMNLKDLKKINKTKGRMFKQQAGKNYGKNFQNQIKKNNLIK